MIRNDKIDWFMHHAKTCENPNSLEYDTQGGVCFIEAAKYIKCLEADVRHLQCSIGDLLEKT